MHKKAVLLFILTFLAQSKHLGTRAVVVLKGRRRWVSKNQRKKRTRGRKRAAPGSPSFPLIM